LPVFLRIYLTFREFVFNISKNIIDRYQVAAKKKGSKLRKFFLRVKARRGHNVAVVALAREILCILYHLQMKQEMFQEDGVEKSRASRLELSSSTISKMSLQTMIEIIE
jgi:hypothetical protein